MGIGRSDRYQSAMSLHAMSGLVPGIHVLAAKRDENGRVKPAMANLSLPKCF